MKKLLLLIASSSIALTAGAQYKASPITMPDNDIQAVKTHLAVSPSEHRKMSNVAAKGTAANRIYSFNYWLDTTLEIAGANTTESVMALWKDTTAQITYTSGTQQNTFVCAAEILDPSFPGFNNPDFFEGDMKITKNDAFVVKKLSLWGLYSFNPAKTHTDTIRLSFVKGTGAVVSPPSNDIFSGYSLGAGGHYGTVDFLDMYYDSVRNYATNYTNVPSLAGPANTVVDILLNNSGATPAYGDTTAGGLMYKTVTLPGSGLSVPANGYVGVSVSFISGDATFPGTLPGTVVGNASTNTWTYNMFRPLLQYRTDGATDDPQWLDYTDWSAPDSNANCGFFRRLPAFSNGWAGTFVPMWAWSTGSGTTASALQHLYLDWEIECTACGVVGTEPTTSVASVNNINTASAYPNPAANELNIPFTLNNSSDVTVTLTNVVGQVVGTQTFKNVATGKAVFNTTSMANGVYSYSVSAGGQRMTGRVAIAH